MASVCFYFQIHQPYRLRRYSVFDTDQHYFDEQKNAEIMRKVAQKCYLPASRMLLETIRQHEGRFRIAFSMSGVVLEQFEAYAPEVIEVFKELAATGHVEAVSGPRLTSPGAARCASSSSAAGSSPAPG